MWWTGMRPWRANWEAAIVSRATGCAVPLTFVRFTTEDEAILWCAAMNQGLGEDDPMFGYSPRPAAAATESAPD